MGVTDDIAMGRERHVKIRCVNEVDDLSPPKFVYVADIVEASVIQLLRRRKDPDFLACDCRKVLGRPGAQCS